MSTTEQQLPADVLDYLAQHNTLTLATASAGGIPRATTFLYVNDGPTLYFWTRAGTATARHIEQNPIVSFTIDDYNDDLTLTRGIQGSGECSVLLGGEEIARIADLFGQKFPALAPGATMSLSFFRIAPTGVDFIDSKRARGASVPGVFGADFHRERSFSVLGGLPTREAGTISASLQTTTAEAGEVVARQGGPADKFFVVVEGELEVTRGDEEAGIDVQTVGPGELYGEIAILIDRPRNATVRATKPTTLLVVDGPTFRDLVAQSLGVSGQFDEVIRDRLAALRGAA
jgi:uncharacterized protein YhbP (UPF0306 family)